MATPYVGEIRITGFNFAPVNWALCDGSLLQISQNTTLFNLIGTTYGGDGLSTFQLPNLCGRVPVAAGLSYTLGQTGGANAASLVGANLPQHSHLMVAADVYANQANPVGNFAGRLLAVNAYAPTPNAAFPPGALHTAGSGAPHNNMQPYLGVNYIIALYGVYPSQI